MSTNIFAGRSLCVSDDFSIDEKKYLFTKTRELKQAWEQNDLSGLNKFRINDHDFGIYEVFLEDSTRTRESFRNAAKFHGAKLYHIFVVRSSQEGLCRWLQISGEKYAQRNRLNFIPSFINAGDGKHEHPTQELLDEFTLLEDNDWSTANLHLALVGDLFHGRTVHSKADGLTIFDNVQVDLIAPPELSMPRHYIDRMAENNITTRIYPSLEEYFNQPDVASRFYFTRPQLERMGERVLKRQDELRDKITFKEEFLEKLPGDSYFYHPLPRHKKYPTIPTFLDSSPVNHLEKQSINGMFVRIILQSAIAGKIGGDFSGETVKKQEYSDDFVVEVSPSESKSRKIKEGINPLTNGVVIDRFCRGESVEDIWDYLSKTMKIMDFKKYKGSVGVGESKKQPNVFKGLIFLPNLKELSGSDLRRLAAVTAGCTVNVIQDNQVARKLRLTSPPRIYNIKDTSCVNEACISNAANFENIPPEFIRKRSGSLECFFCNTAHKFKDIWR